MSREEQGKGAIPKRPPRRDGHGDSPAWTGLLAIGAHSGGNGLRIGSSSQSLSISLVEDALDDLLLLGSENLGQAVIELRLLLLEV